jgi:formyltetrahydrofolate-dependent phosphoribosylglycinamide formyltransferase
VSAAEPLRVAVLLSGSGTSLENLFEQIEQRGLPARVVCVIASKENAGGVARAAKRGVPAVAIPRKKFADVRSFNDALHAELAKHDPQLVACLGFLSIFELRERYRGRAINVHPALIPAFAGKGMYGQRVHEAVLARGCKVTGATVHFVDDEYDHGPIISQRAVPVLDGDTPDTLAARVQAAERELVPEAVRAIAEGRVKLEGQRVRIAPEGGDAR